MVRWATNKYQVKYPRGRTGSILKRGKYWTKGFKRARPIVISLGGRRKYRNYTPKWLRTHKFMWLRSGRKLIKYG